MPARISAPTRLRNLLKEWRQYRGMTIQEVAEAIGTSKGHISRIENGHANLMPDVAQAVADVLGIGVETLWKVPPSQAADAEQDLLTIYRDAGTEQQRKILQSARKLSLR